MTMMMMMRAPVLEREILEIFRDDDNHDHAAAAALHNSHKNTRSTHTITPSSRREKRLSLFAETMRRW